MKSARTTTVCIIYDEQIAALVGVKSAQAFEWLYSFLHLATKTNGEVYEGRRWGAFTYNQLAELSDALPNAFAWRRALTHLVTEKLLFEDEAPGLGKYYCIDFAGLRKRLGDGFAGYQLDMQDQNLPEWDSTTPPKKRPRRQRRSEQSAQTNPEQSAQTTLSKTPRPPEQSAQTLLYGIDSSLDSSDDSSTTGDALTLTPHQALVEKFYQVTFGCVPGRKRPTSADYKRVNKQITEIAKEFDKPTADMMDGWLVWRVYLDTWNKDASMPTKPSDVPPTWARFLQFHKKDPNWLARFESKYPDWRDYIYTDCNPNELRQKIQANVASQRGNNPPSKLKDWQRGIHKPVEMTPMTEEEIRATIKLIEG